MNLFFDGVSTQGYIALFSQQREIIAGEHFHISGNESTKTIPIIDEFLSTQKISYSDIDNIVTVVGPGSFTGVRTVSLVINTISYIHPHIDLTAVNFFDMYDTYPIIKASSKRDLFVKYKKSATIEIVKNDNFSSKYEGEKVYGDVNDEHLHKKYIISGEIDYERVIKKLELTGEKRIAPLYIKKPNIS